MFPVKHNNIVYHHIFNIFLKKYSTYFLTILLKCKITSDQLSLVVQNIKFKNLDPPQQVHKCFRDVPSFNVQSSKNEKGFHITAALQTVNMLLISGLMQENKCIFLFVLLILFIFIFYIFLKLKIKWFPF